MFSELQQHLKNHPFRIGGVRIGARGDCEWESGRMFDLYVIPRESELYTPEARPEVRFQGYYPKQSKWNRFALELTVGGEETDLTLHTAAFGFSWFVSLDALPFGKKVKHPDGTVELSPGLNRCRIGEWFEERFAGERPPSKFGKLRNRVRKLRGKEVQAFPKRNTVNYGYQVDPYGSPRTTGISFFDAHWSIRFWNADCGWANDDHYRFPWEGLGWSKSVFIRDVVLGERDANREILYYFSAWVFCPEPIHFRVRLSRLDITRTHLRPEGRWGKRLLALGMSRDTLAQFTETGVRVEYEFGDPPTVPGKGTTSYNCGDSSLCSGVYFEDWDPDRMLSSLKQHGMASDYLTQVTNRIAGMVWKGRGTSKNEELREESKKNHAKVQSGELVLVEPKYREWDE